MRKLLLISSLFLMGACATQKEAVKTETKVESESSVTLEKKETRQAETTTYGDTLKGNNFLPLDGGRTSFGLESTGLKVGFELIPMFNPAGNLMGYQVNTEAAAKPTSKTKESTTTQTNTQAQHTQTVKEKVAEQQSTKKGSWLTWFLLIAVPVFYIALTIWIIKIHKNGAI